MHVCVCLGMFVNKLHDKLSICNKQIGMGEIDKHKKSGIK